MNEEKKMDEKELEDVSGGCGLAVMANTIFQQNNCFFCSKRNTTDCPYHGNITQAPRDYGADGTCPHKA